MNIIYVLIFFLYYLNIFLYTVYGFNLWFYIYLYDYNVLTILELKGEMPLGSLEKGSLCSHIDIESLDQDENKRKRMARIRTIANSILEPQKAAMRNKTHLCIAANRAWREAWALEAREWEEASRIEEETSYMLRCLNFWEQFKEIKRKPPELQ